MKIDRLIKGAAGLPWHSEAMGPLWLVDSDDPEGPAVGSVLTAEDSALVVHLSKVAPLYRELVNHAQMSYECIQCPSKHTVGCDKCGHTALLTRIKELEDE